MEILRSQSNRVQYLCDYRVMFIGIYSSSIYKFRLFAKDIPTHILLFRINLIDQKDLFCYCIHGCVKEQRKDDFHIDNTGAEHNSCTTRLLDKIMFGLSFQQQMWLAKDLQSYVQLPYVRTKVAFSTVCFELYYQTLWIGIKKSCYNIYINSFFRNFLEMHSLFCSCLLH